MVPSSKVWTPKKAGLCFDQLYSPYLQWYLSHSKCSINVTWTFLFLHHSYWPFSSGYELFWEENSHLLLYTLCLSFPLSNLSRALRMASLPVSFTSSSPISPKTSLAALPQFSLLPLPPELYLSKHQLLPWASPSLFILSTSNIDISWAGLYSEFQTHRGGLLVDISHWISPG